ncbi:hypothetical protein BDN72DRAFT_95516 [Pluteus cervinus]|uniref:Uncharacterized protein n=1 Tax=Pluteus cervinus TaxID=181527 RepID=A0ACD3AP45_9AGAR|nr:hypothetical protein BDN72DRAFT_95516 [Pluteus cervinus]
MHRRVALEQDQREHIREEIVKTQGKARDWRSLTCHAVESTSTPGVPVAGIDEIPFLVCLRSPSRFIPTDPLQIAPKPKSPSRARPHIQHLPTRTPFCLTVPHFYVWSPCQTSASSSSSTSPNSPSPSSHHPYTHLSGHSAPRVCTMPKMNTVHAVPQYTGTQPSSHPNLSRASSGSYNSGTGEAPTPTPPLADSEFIVVGLFVIVLWSSDDAMGGNGMSGGGIGDTFGLHICGLIGINQTHERREGNIHDKKRAKLTLCCLSNRWGWIAGWLFERRSQCTPEALIEKGEGKERSRRRQGAEKSKKRLVGPVSLCKSSGSPVSLCKPPDVRVSKTLNMVASRGGGYSSESWSTALGLPQLSPISPLTTSRPGRWLEPLATPSSTIQLHVGCVIAGSPQLAHKTRVSSSRTTGYMRTFLVPEAPILPLQLPLVSDSGRSHQQSATVPPVYRRHRREHVRVPERS